MSKKERHRVSSMPFRFVSEDCLAIATAIAAAAPATSATARTTTSTVAAASAAATVMMTTSAAISSAAATIRPAIRTVFVLAAHRADGRLAVIFFLAAFVAALERCRRTYCRSRSFGAAFHAGGSTFHLGALFLEDCLARKPNAIAFHSED